jgi:hypothetical protein
MTRSAEHIEAVPQLQLTLISLELDAPGRWIPSDGGGNKIKLNYTVSNILHSR